MLEINDPAHTFREAAVSFLLIPALERNDRMLTDFPDMESSLVVSMHVQPIDQVKAIG